MFVGTKRTVAPRVAMRLAGSRKLESLQMMMPNVSPLTVNTGMSWPGSYTDRLMAGCSLR